MPRKAVHARIMAWGFCRRSQLAGITDWPHDVMRHTAISHYFRLTGSYGRSAEMFGNSEASSRRTTKGACPLLTRRSSTRCVHNERLSHERTRHDAWMQLCRHAGSSTRYALLDERTRHEGRFTPRLRRASRSLADEGGNAELMKELMKS